MPIFSRCCCCKLKTGCMVLGVLMVVGGLWNFGSTLTSLIKREGPPTDEAIQEQIEAFEEIGIHINKDDLLLLDEIHFYGNVLAFVGSLISVPTYTLLMVGVQTSTYKFIFPALVWLPISFVGSIIFSIVLMAIFDHVFVIIVLLVVAGITAVMDLLFWLCIYSHWQEVKTQVGAPQKI